MRMPWLADAVLLVHLAYVGFVVLGFVAVIVGGPLGWRWVRHRWLRRLHLAAIALVAVEALAGVMCPLTEWEALLRGQHAPQSFVGRAVHAVLFYDLPAWVFTVAYVGLTALALMLYWLVPPESSPARPGAGRRPRRTGE